MIRPIFNFYILGYAILNKKVVKLALNYIHNSFVNSLKVLKETFCVQLKFKFFELTLG